jgi:hypothetical protein
MMQIAGTKIHIGGEESHSLTNDREWAVVNTAQTIHYGYMGWDRKYNKPSSNHPNYILLERDQLFSLNWVDGAARVYEWTKPEGFTQILDFVDKWYPSKQILINCNLGLSRSPSVALLYLAKRLHTISDTSFDDAQAEFLTLYPRYQPAGIADYLRANWAQIT